MAGEHGGPAVIPASEGGDRILEQNVWGDWPYWPALGLTERP